MGAEGEMIGNRQSFASFPWSRKEKGTQGVRLLAEIDALSSVIT